MNNRDKEDCGDLSRNLECDIADQGSQASGFGERMDLGMTVSSSWVL